MTQPKGFRTASRRYLMVFWPLMALYCIAISLALTFVDTDTAPVPVRAAVALMVSLPLVGILWSVMRLVLETDEYTRMREFRALTEAGLILTAFLFVIGFLERFEVIGDVPLFLFGPGFFALYGLAHMRQRIGKTV